MKVTVTVFRDNDAVPFRKYIVKPKKESEVEETQENVSSFISECFEEIEEEGYYDGIGN